MAELMSELFDFVAGVGFWLFVVLAIVAAVALLIGAGR